MNRATLRFLYRHTHKAQSVEPSHSHPCPELVYYVSGEGKCIIGKEEFSYKPGTYAYIQPNMKHSEYHETETQVLFFGFVHQEEEELELRSGVYQDRRKKVSKMFESVESELRNKKPFFRYAIGLKACEILLEVARENNTRKEERNILEECMSYAKEYITQNIHQKINLQDLATSVGYSYDYFRHQFQKSFGMSPKEFILKEKINRVKMRLANKNDSIAELAVRYAFEDTSHLVRTFKTMVGCTPTEYREKTKADKIEIVVDYHKNDDKK